MRESFDGDVQVDITGLPPGFTSSTPLVIQAGHSEAKGTINAALNAPQPNDTNSAQTKITATAMLAGKQIIKEVNNFGKIKLGEKPKVFVSLESTEHTSTNVDAATACKPIELTIAPGQTIPAWLKIKRNGHDDLVTFFVENLPHGVIVDNIGLNGLLIVEGQTEREFFITASKIAKPTTRTFHLHAKADGNQVSPYAILRVLPSTPNQVATRN